MTDIIIIMWIANCRPEASIRQFCNAPDISVSIKHYDMEKGIWNNNFP